MKQRMQLFNPRIMTVMIFMIWSCILSILIYTNAYQAFLQPRFRTLIIFSILVFTVFLISAAVKLIKERSYPLKFIETFIQFCIFIIPAIFIYLSFGENLGVHALSKRMVQESHIETPVPITKKKESRLDTSDDYYTLIEINSHFKELENHKVVTTGTLFRETELPENYLLLFQFAIVCCAADAVPQWVLVEKNKSQVVDSEENWVQVSGQLVERIIDGRKYPVIKEEKIENIPSPGPKGRYLYFSK